MNNEAVAVAAKPASLTWFRVIFAAHVCVAILLAAPPSSAQDAIFSIPPIAPDGSVLLAEVEALVGNPSGDRLTNRVASVDADRDVLAGQSSAEYARMLELLEQSQQLNRLTREIRGLRRSF